MAWYEYDHASDEQTKALRRAHRDALIRVALLPHDLRITDFLRIAMTIKNGSSIRNSMRDFGVVDFSRNVRSREIDSSVVRFVTIRVIRVR